MRGQRSKQSFKCPVCGKTFERYPKRGKYITVYCSRECYDKALKGGFYKYIWENRKKGIEKKCPVCNTLFYVAKEGTQIYCSRPCYDKIHAIKEKICPICQKPFIPPHGNQTCSIACSYKLRSGENNFKWIGGKDAHKTERGKGFNMIRKQILDRDDHKCQICGKPIEGRDAVVHHIKEWKADLDATIQNKGENLLSLCRACHALTHKQKQKYKTVKSIRLVKEKAVVHDIEVEVDHSYRAGGVLVHNCMICASLDNTIYAALEGEPLPDHVPSGVINAHVPPHPAHNRCRCIIVPVLEGDSERLLERKLTYENWFNGQKPEVQLDILGPSRYKLFREGQITIKQFVKDNKVITLKDLGASRITRKTLANMPGTGEPGEGPESPPGTPRKAATGSEDYKGYLSIPEDLKPLTNDQWGKIAGAMEQGAYGHITVDHNGRHYTVYYDVDGLRVQGTLVLSRDDFLNQLIKAGAAIEDPRLRYSAYMQSIQSMKPLNRSEQKDFRTKFETLFRDNIKPDQLNSKAVAETLTKELKALPDSLQRMIYDVLPDTPFTIGERSFFDGSGGGTGSISFYIPDLQEDSIFTVFHELGHAIDYRLSHYYNVSGGIVSQKANSWAFSELFRAVAKTNYDTVIEAFKKAGTLDKYKWTNRKNPGFPIPLAPYAGASDFLMGFSALSGNTVNDLLGDFGHLRDNPDGTSLVNTKDFYRDHLMSEIMANMIAELAGRGGLSPLFDDTLAVFKEWLRLGKTP
jgi:hypothetical protein